MAEVWRAAAPARGAGRPKHLRTGAERRLPLALGYQPALDGLRAIAVTTVLLYHGGVSWMPGGFLGVDVFFILSGFLITSLLVTEHQRTGHISIRSFYERRLRRLTPALLLMLAAVVLYAATVAPDSALVQLRGDVIATLGYVANWRLVVADRGYFDAFSSPSPLSHTWSLAVEEQWYLGWPLVAGALLGRRGRQATRLRRALGGSILLLVASAGWTMWIYRPGSDPSRVYYGTDTRAQQLLAGAVLALACALAGRFELGRWSAKLADVAAAGGLAWVLWQCTEVDDQTGWLYDGGQVVVAIAVAAIVLGVLQPRSVVRRALACRPMRYVGRISYGLYLWHIPVFVIGTSERLHLDGTALLLGQLAVTAVIAAASHRVIEEPIRLGARIRRPALVAAPAMATLLGIAVLTTAGTPSSNVSVFGAPAPTRPPTSTTSAPAVSEPGAPVTTATTVPVTVGVGPNDYLHYDAADIPAPRADPGAVRLVITGDSVALNLSLGHVQGSGDPPVVLWDQSALGCSLFDTARVAGGRTFETHPLCPSWRARRPAWIDAWRPQVVAVLAGTWDVYDTVVDGSHLAFGSPEFDAWYHDQWDLLIELLSARGATVAVLTTPCNERVETLTVRDPPENDRRRTAHLNSLLSEVVERHPSDAALVDLHALLCDGDDLIERRDGIALRTEDGVHLTPDGAALLRHELFPQLAALADAAPLSGSTRSPQR